jgi:hypothetical protein
MTPKQSFLRRCLAVLSAALLAAALVIVGTWLPAGATGTHGEGGDRDDVDALRIVLITDQARACNIPFRAGNSMSSCRLSMMTVNRSSLQGDQDQTEAGVRPGCACGLHDGGHPSQHL